MFLSLICNTILRGENRAGIGSDRTKKTKMHTILNNGGEQNVSRNLKIWFFFSYVPVSMIWSILLFFVCCVVRAVWGEFQVRLVRRKERAHRRGQCTAAQRRANKPPLLTLNHSSLSWKSHLT